MKKTIFTLLVVAISFILYQCKTASEVKPMSGNPVFEGWYADPEGMIFDGKYWIYPTYSALYEEQVFMDAFSSTDLVTWTKHERIVDTSAVKWVKMAMWHRP